MDLTSTYQLKWAWSLTKDYRFVLLLYFILELLAILFSISFVVYSKKAVDVAIMGSSLGLLRETIWFMVFFVGMGLLSKSCANWANERTKAKLLVDLQNKVILSQMKSSWSMIKCWHTGDVQVRINVDCQEIVQMVVSSALSFVLTAIRLFVSFGYLWMLDPMLAFLLLSITPLILFSKVYFKKLRSLNKLLKESESALANVVQENLRFRLLIRTLGVQQRRWRKVVQQQMNNFQLKIKLLNFSTLSQTLMKLAINIGFLLTFIWGVYKLNNAEISFGTMAVFLQLVGRVQTPILSLVSFAPSFVRFRTSVDRVRELLSTEIEEDIEPEYIRHPCRILLHGVSFSYNEHPVIERLDAVLEAGSPVAVLGASGKGKTTLIRLLLALLKPDQGRILIHGEHGQSELSNRHRINIAYVPQGDKLFSGNIRENLQVEEGEASEEKIKNALYLACAGFVYNLPDGLDTEIGESGYGLSEGQAQRIAIARAMMRDSSIWLFDEVTSALDPKISEMVMQRLMEAGKDKIIVFVTHDMELAKTCSQTINII